MIPQSTRQTCFFPRDIFRQPACLTFHPALDRERVDRYKTPVCTAISETHQSPERKTENTDDRSLYAGGENELCGEWTTNKSELLCGYFVKFGDGGVDIEPIANMYKLQVYRLSELLKIDKKIISRAPSPDTWSHFTSDEDFYLRMPYDILDQLLYAEEHGLPRRLSRRVRADAGQMSSALNIFIV